jgi:hypothetical protein
VLWRQELEAELRRESIIFCISVDDVSASGGNVIDGAGTLHSLKKPSAPAGATITSSRSCSESMVNECAAAERET